MKQIEVEVDQPKPDWFNVWGRNENEELVLGAGATLEEAVADFQRAWRKKMEWTPPPRGVMSLTVPTKDDE